MLGLYGYLAEKRIHLTEAGLSCYDSLHMKRWVKITIGVLIFLSIAGFLGWRLWAGAAAKPTKTVQATKQTITKDVAFTGKVTAKQSAGLSFELSGIVKDISVQVGDTVQKGEVLALLDPQSVELEVVKAHADAASTTSAEYLSWQKASEDAKHTEAENAKTLEQKRQAVRDAKKALDQSKTVFTKKAGESGDDASVTLATQSTVLANEAAYNAAKAALATTVTTTTKSNAAAKKSADIAYSQYTSAIQAAPGDTSLSSLEALKRLAQVKAAKSIMRAPFAGVVTAKKLEVGELATAGVAVITVETLDSLELTSDVPETDAFVLAQGMEASVTFDALPSNSEIAARITSIAPAAIDIEGVPTFLVTLTPSTTDTLLRSGLTANITVHAAKKDNVLAIPRRAIIRKDEKQFVRKQTGEEVFEEVEITTGLAGSDGLVEIISGVNEGDTLATP